MGEVIPFERKSKMVWTRTLLQVVKERLLFMFHLHDWELKEDLSITTVRHGEKVKIGSAWTFMCKDPRCRKVKREVSEL